MVLVTGISLVANFSPQSETVNDQYRILSISHVKFREMTPTPTDFVTYFALLSPKVCTKVCTFMN